MKDDLLKIINHYGVMNQLKYFQSEVFELNEAIFIALSDDTISLDVEHITEEIADVQVMLNQFKYYYGITDEDIKEVMEYKINRQLERIKNEQRSNI